MINSSVEFNRELQNDNRDYRFIINMTTRKGQTFRLTGENLWENSLSFTEGTSSSDSFDLGGAIVGQCKFVINDIYEEYDDYDFFNATFTLDIGLVVEHERTEYIRKGFYTVSSAEYNGSLISITALDNMWRFDVPFSEVTGVSYPITASNLISRICTYCNVTLATYTFNFSNFNIPKPDDNGEMNCREVLSYIGQICCIFFKINTEGALTVGWYDDSQIIDQDNINGGSFETTTNPYGDGDILNGGTFEYGRKSEENVVTSLNYSDFFDVRNEYYGFFLSRDTWSAENVGVNNTTAITRLKPWRKGTVKFNWKVNSEKNYDIFTITHNGTQIVKASGENQSGSVELSVEFDDTIEFKYSKDSSTHATNEVASFNNMIFKTYGEDVFDGGTFLGFNGIAYLTSNNHMSVGTDEITVTGVQTLNKDDENGYDFTSGSAGYVLVIENNPFVNKDNHKTVANNVASIVNGFVIRTFDASTLSNPKWQSGDACAIADFKGRRFYSFITNLTFSSGSFEKVSCGAVNPTEKMSVRYSDAVKTAVALARKQVNEKISDYDKIVQNMNALAVNAMGLRWAEVNDINGNSIFYMSNSPITVSADKTSATFTVGSKLWKMTGSGFFCCLSAQSTDSQCAWTNGWDSEGNVVVNTLSTIGLNFDWAYGGTLTLGGSNNRHGKLTILNSSGEECGTFDNNGIRYSTKDKYGDVRTLSLDSNNGEFTSSFNFLKNGEIIGSLSGTAKNYDGDSNESVTLNSRKFLGLNGDLCTRITSNKRVDILSEKNVEITAKNLLELKQGELSVHDTSTGMIGVGQSGFFNFPGGSLIFVNGICIGWAAD